MDESSVIQMKPQSILAKIPLEFAFVWVIDFHFRQHGYRYNVDMYLHIVLLE